jgi:hypothetical protein
VSTDDVRVGTVFNEPVHLRDSFVQLGGVDTFLSRKFIREIGGGACLVVGIDDGDVLDGDIHRILFRFSTETHVFLTEVGKPFITLTFIDIKVNILYTGRDEKNPSSNPIS